MLKRMTLVVLALAMLVGLAACEVAEQTNPSTSPTKKPAETANPFADVVSQDGVNELYQLSDADNGQMMSYMVKTKSGKLIMLDGGYERNANDIIALAQHLTGDEVPVIDTWLFTHAHSDHVNAFYQIMMYQVKSLSVKNIYHHFTSEDFILKKEPGSVTTHRKFMKAVGIAEKTGATTHVVEQGDKLTVDGIDIEVMLVPDETASTVDGVYINEASVVFRYTIDGQTVLFLGDIYHTSGTRLQAAHGDALKSDVVQMAHHGSQGAQNSTYAKIAPKVCLWPTPDWLWENNAGGQGPGTGTWETPELYRYMQDALGVTKHYVAKDGLQQLSFPLDLA